MDRREAALEPCAPRGELALLLDGHALRRVVRMRHDHLRDPGRESRVDGGVDLGPAEVPGREHELVTGDDLEHPREAVRREPHGLGRHAGGRELVLDLAPDRLLGRLGAVLTGLVLGVHGRQPDDPRTSPGRDLDRLRVEPADAGVERDRTQGVDAGHGAPHDGCALRRGRVVRLEHEARQPELAEAAGEREVVDAPLREVGLDMDVQIVGPADELARAGRRLSGRRCGQEALPPRAPAASP